MKIKGGLKNMKNGGTLDFSNFLKLDSCRLPRPKTPFHKSPLFSIGLAWYGCEIFRIKRTFDFFPVYGVETVALGRALMNMGQPS